MQLPTSDEIEESKRKRVEEFSRLGEKVFKKFRSEKEAAATTTIATATVATAATTAAANSLATAQSIDAMSVTKGSIPLTGNEMSQAEIELSRADRLQRKQEQQANSKQRTCPGAAGTVPLAKKPLTDSEAMKIQNQRSLATAHESMPFMKSVMNANQKWQEIKMDSEYVPAIGSCHNGQAFVPEDFSTILAMSPPCARGKSTAFKNWMDEIYGDKPSARILLLSANILYGTSLKAEMDKKFKDQPGVKVGFYRDAPDGKVSEHLDKCNVVICSFESLHHIDGQHFEVILIDEIRTIAGLVGGRTMPDFNNIYVMKELAENTKKIVVCDADLIFKMSPSETNTKTTDFMKLLFDSRPVLHGSLSHPGPGHLQRSADLYFDHGNKQRNYGKNCWKGEIRRAAEAWHRDNTKRFAICVGSLPQLTEIYKWLLTLKVPVKPYSGDTNENSKFEDLRDADSAWKPFGCVLSTTSLSIGVDPKKIEFDRVFMWTHPHGCTLIAMFQAAMRFARQADHPLGNQAVCMLVKCIPPGEREKLVKLKKKKPIINPTFEDVYRRLSRRRGASSRMAAKEIMASGGQSVGVGVPRNVEDQILRVMAHNILERNFQRDNHYEVVKRCIQHYGWTINRGSLVRAEATGPLNLDEINDVTEDEDDHFAHGCSQNEKWETIIEKIIENGEHEFFNECYGLSTKTMTQHKTSVQQYLVKAYWLLKPVQRLPYFHDVTEKVGDDDTKKSLSAADQLEQMSQPGVLDGLRLNAHMRCMDAETAMLSDSVRRSDPDAKVPHPMLRLGIGQCMEIGLRLALHIGVEHPYKDCDFSEPLGLEWVLVGSQKPPYGEPIISSTLKDALQYRTDFTQTELDAFGLGKSLRRSNFINAGSDTTGPRYYRPATGRILDILRRETFKEITNEDTDFIRRLQGLVSEMQPIDRHASAPSRGMYKLLSEAAALFGMRLVCDKERVSHKGADHTQRERIFTSIRFEQLLPDIVDDWHIFSHRLGHGVCTQEWHDAHASVDDEEGQLGMQNDSELDSELYTALISAGQVRYEKIDGTALDAELKRLTSLMERGHFTERDKRWYDWILAAHGEAIAQVGTHIRIINVTYGKSAHRVIGRRTASYPSMQPCPSGLRPLLVGFISHDLDIVNCHPTLMLQVADKMEVERHKIERLVEYVFHRARVLQRIADHYGITVSKAKFGVIRVLNGGSIAAWVNDVKTGCMRGKEQPQDDLRDLEKVATVVHDAFFAMPQFKDPVVALRKELKATTSAKVQAAEERLRSATSKNAKERAQTELNNVRRKASMTAVDRSVFSACIFELEDMVLAEIDKYLQSMGWTVSSLQFDGLHVDHRSTDRYNPETGKWAEIEKAISGAEQAVKEALGYEVKLKEKELYHHTPTEAALVEADSVDVEIAHA